MKYVFVSMDGTLAEWKKIKGEFQERDFIDKKPMTTVMEEILYRYGNEEYCVIIYSKVPCTQATFEKNVWLDAYFRVPYENRLYVGQYEKEFDVIQYYIEKVQGREMKDNIIIDCNDEVLTRAQEAEVECYHPTQLITACEQRKLEIAMAEQEAAKAEEASDEEKINSEEPEEPIASEGELVDVEFVEE